MEPSFAAEGAASEHAPAADPLKLYVRQIGGGALLTREEERELARRKDAGDEEAKKRLIESTSGDDRTMTGRHPLWLNRRTRGRQKRSW